MAPIVNSVEISRRPEDVFAYVTDPTHLPEWQESVVSVRADSPFHRGLKGDGYPAHGPHGEGYDE